MFHIFSLASLAGLASLAVAKVQFFEQMTKKMGN